VSELSRLKGLGPKRLQALQRSGLTTLRDLVNHLPRTYLDRTRFRRIADLEPGQDGFAHVIVHDVTHMANRMLVTVGDDSGQLELAFFQALPFLKGRFHPGVCLTVAGTVTLYRGLQMVHPEWEIVSAETEPKPQGLLPRYPLTEAMGEARIEHKLLQGWAIEALGQFTFSDPLAPLLKKAAGLRDEMELLRTMHKPDSMETVEAGWREVKLRELLPLFHGMEMRRRSRADLGKAYPPSQEWAAKLMTLLPFTLTLGQQAAAADIASALNSRAQFTGLLQGDVGSGKTVVALLACLGVLAAGAQVALLAPTGILAVQHFRTVQAWLEGLGIATKCLTGDVVGESRETILKDLAEGRCPFVVGTHALIGETVQFKQLGLVLIDEQHRFGVKQREALLRKGEYPHLLYLSATPIPRTLAQTLYGDMEVMTLTEKPPGRLPVKTRLVAPAKRREMLGFLLSEAKTGNQIFWVVPRISGSENPGDAEDAAKEERTAARGVEQVTRELREYSSDWQVASVHGRMAADKRDETLTAFRNGEIQVLVATTVIEVGVDIPQANLMVIEGPDRFGLAQLHQLRGRTGRGGQQAWCFLLLGNEMPEASESRLRSFSQIDDGFALAELDLQQRGAGHLDGTVQSGFGTLRYADLVKDKELVDEVRGLVRSL
jgi:ATP-dependent DNA helicase RecG